MKLLGQTLERSDLIHVIPRLIVAIILAQTLPFKFLGAEESKEIFQAINMEPWGRYLVASFELAAVIFLLSRYYIVGAIIALSFITTANFFHFMRLGIEVNGDGGQLFIYSIIVIVCSLWTVVHWNWYKRKKRKIDFASLRPKDEGDLEG